MASVMVVDDEDILANMIAELIEEIGCRAVVATNGCDALQRLQAESERPALIISDVMMPHMNGMDLARTLRGDPRFDQVPIVLMSAAGDPAHGGLANDFLPKPFDVDQFEALIQHYVDDC